MEIIMEKKIFCKSGGCSAKLGAGVLDHVLAKLPRKEDKNLLVGYDTKDDFAIAKQLSQEGYDLTIIENKP